MRDQLDELQLLSWDRLLSCSQSGLINYDLGMRTNYGSSVVSCLLNVITLVAVVIKSAHGTLLVKGLWSGLGRLRTEIPGSLDCQTWPQLQTEINN